MRCSLVPLVVRSLHARCTAGPVNHGNSDPIRHRPRYRFGQLALSAALAWAPLTTALTTALLTTIEAPRAYAEGPALYSSLALNNPALAPVLASAEHSLLWSTNGRLNNQAIDAMAVLARVTEHGLPSSRYALGRLTALSLELAEPATEFRFNELLTAAIETYAIDLLQGLQPSAFKDRRDPKHRSRGRETMQSQLQTAVLKALHRSIATNRVAKFVKSIEPQHSDYRTLQGALTVYRDIAANGGWPEVPRTQSGKMLVPGMIDPRVGALRERLAVTEILNDGTPAAPASLDFYGDALQAAVRSFQRKHGLKADGKVGKHTRRALNVSVEQRIQQLELNLDRWRLMPKVMPANHIWVNVPEYHLRLQIEREEVLDMRVVVGARKWPTAMMHDQLEHVVFNPYWYPPRSISVREILPKVKADPSYLDTKNFDVLLDKQPIDASTVNWDDITAANFKYRFRQRPGQTNSLGEVKFMFPNHYSIYLHDTNAKSLFNNPERALSHGCVRVEEPDALATAILEWDRGWNNKNVSRAMTGNRQKYVKLKQTLPVYLVYFTASVKNETVYFHQDIYGHDARHNAAKDNASPTLVARLLEQHDKHQQPSNENLSKKQRNTTAGTTVVAAARGAR